MKFCIKCGNQLSEDALFCQKCGANQPVIKPDDPQSPHNLDINPDQSTPLKKAKLRTSMQIWMIICFVFAGIFTIGAIADASMLAGVCLFGILAAMFLNLAKLPKGQTRVFANLVSFKKTQGISKGAFVGICVFLAIFSFATIMNASTTSTPSNAAPADNTAVIENTQKNEQTPINTEPKIPSEFAGECPVSVSASIFDNIIGFPELSCSIKNKTNKKITAVKVYFAPRDVYGEKSDNLFTTNKLYTDDEIAPNGSKSCSWQLLDQSVKSADLYIYSVYFADGTEWGDRNAPLSKIEKYAYKAQVTY